MSEINWVHKDSTTIKEARDKETQQKVIENTKDYIIEQLQQENKQLKEELEKEKKYNTELMLCNSRFNAILTELEEWLKDKYNPKETINIKLSDRAEQDEYIAKLETENQYKLDLGQIFAVQETLDKIQELKEKYK